MPYIVVLPDGALQPVREEWRTPPAHVPAAEQDLKWEEVCGDLISFAAGKYPTSSVNVFLVFDRFDLVERDRVALESVLQRARERCWGARLFVVLCNAPRIARIPAGERPDLAAWMSAMRDGRVCDVVQLAESVESTRKETLRIILKNHATAVIERQKVLLDGSGLRPWRCALPVSLLETGDVLGPELATTKTDGQGASDLVILVAGSTRAQREREIERHLVKDPFRRRRYRVVTCDEDRLPELQGFCRRKEIGAPMVLGGDFELWYLMLRLNELSKSTAYAPESIDPVDIAPSARLAALNDRTRLTVLLTSTFDQCEERQWLAAAADVGKLLHLSPNIDFRIELAIDTNRLLQVLKGMPTVIDAWIHLGHGSGREGLWVPQQGHVTPGQWVDCFREKELRLAMFLTCRSREIARCFAAEGAGVAVGFEDKLESEKDPELATSILEKMLAGGSNTRSILAGFALGAGRFNAIKELDARPRAYYSRRA